MALKLLVPHQCVIHLAYPSLEVHQDFVVPDSVGILLTFCPCWFVRYLNLLKGVKNVVVSLESLSNGTEWYLFQASIVVL